MRYNSKSFCGLNEQVFFLLKIYIFWSNLICVSFLKHRLFVCAFNLLNDTSVCVACNSTKCRCSAGAVTVAFGTSFRTHNHEVGTNAGPPNVRCDHTACIAEATLYRERNFFRTIRGHVRWQCTRRSKCGANAFMMIWCHFRW